MIEEKNREGLTSQIKNLKQRYEELVQMRENQESQMKSLKEELDKFSEKTRDDISHIEARLDIIES